MGFYMGFHSNYNFKQFPAKMGICQLILIGILGLIWGINFWGLIWDIFFGEMVWDSFVSIICASLRRPSAKNPGGK